MTTRTGQFLRQLLELQLAMALGALACLVIGSALRTSPAIEAVYHPGSPLFFIGDLFFLAAPVAFWMRVRRFRGVSGMALAMVVPVLVIAAAGLVAPFDALGWLVNGMYPVMSAGMLASMLLRRSASGARPVAEGRSHGPNVG